MVEQRYQAVLAVISDGLSVCQVASKVGVWRQTLHAWLARCEAAGIDLCSVTEVVSVRLYMDHVSGLLTEGPKARRGESLAFTHLPYPSSRRVAVAGTAFRCMPFARDY